MARDPLKGSKVSAPKDPTKNRFNPLRVGQGQFPTILRYEDPANFGEFIEERFDTAPLANASAQSRGFQNYELLDA